MVIRIAVRSLDKIQTRRDSTKDILNKDWFDLKQLTEEEAQRLVLLGPTQPSEIDQFDQESIGMKSFNLNSRMKEKSKDLSRKS